MDYQTIREQGKTYIKFLATTENPFDSSLIVALEQLSPQVLLPVDMAEDGMGQHAVLFDVQGRVTLNEYLATAMDVKSFLVVLGQMRKFFDACVQRTLPLKNVVFDYSLVFVNEDQGLLQFMYLPFGNLSPDLDTLISFLRYLPEKASFANIESFELAAKYEAFFQKTGSFNLAEFTHFLGAMCRNSSTCRIAEADSLEGGPYQTCDVKPVRRTVITGDEDVDGNEVGYREPFTTSFGEKSDFLESDDLRPVAAPRVSPPTGVLNQVLWTDGVPEFAADIDCLDDDDEPEVPEVPIAPEIPRKPKAAVVSATPTIELDDDDDLGAATGQAAASEKAPAPLPAGPVNPDRGDGHEYPRYFLRRQKTGELCEIKGGNFVVGKSKYSSFQVRDTTTVSRSHALFSIKENGTCWMEDNASRNGTSIDGIYIRAHEPVELRYGQVVRMSDEDFKVVESADPPMAQKGIF